MLRASLRFGGRVFAMSTAAIVVIAALASGVAGAWWWIFRRALPRTRGSLVLDGLRAPVEIRRDRHGVPHIAASSLEDACFAQGFVHAQDRLWQMELNRRVASGRLAELFGARAVEADRFLRRIGLRRAAQLEEGSLFAEERTLLAAYAAGVNAAVKAMGRRLPLEMRLLRLRPEPWTPTDTLAWSKVLALNLCVNFESELFRAAVIARIGPERAAALELAGCEPEPVTSEPGSTAARVAAEVARRYAEAKAYLPFGAMGASNAWVVAGSRTASGKPILANDPHLALQLPSLWHEAHIAAPGYEVIGAGLPGAPGIVLGQSRAVAWGFTNSNADTQDLFVERFDRERPDRYRFRDEWLEARRVREVIRVAGGEDIVEEVLVTRHGPVLAREGDTALALRWTADDPAHVVAALVAMGRASDAKAFREALRLWSCPSQNVVFADAQDIGYVMAGAVPIRARGDGFIPVPGWDGEHEWLGWIRFDELPQAWNPSAGYVVTANNRTIGQDYRHHISWDFLNSHRAERIERLLLDAGKLGVDDCRRMQLDQRCAAGLALAEAIGALAPRSELEAAALPHLRGWDGEASADSVGAAIYEVCLLELARAAFEPAIGAELTAELLGRARQNPISLGSTVLGRYTGLLARALRARDARFLAAIGREAWEPLLAEALTRGVNALRERLGGDPAQWRWGRLHRLSLAHPLSAAALLRPLFPGRDVPIGGDVDTVMQTAVVPHQPFAARASAPSWRHVADCADLAVSWSALPGGQWGHPRSAYWLDRFERWLRGELTPLSMDEPAGDVLRLEAGTGRNDRERVGPAS
jgi:penicillin amidase